MRESVCVCMCGSVCVCTLWHLLSECGWYGFIQKEAFFGIINDKRKGMSLHIYWFWCCFVAFPLADQNSTAQLHTSEAPRVKRAQHSWISAASNCWTCVSQEIAVFTLIMITATVFPSSPPLLTPLLITDNLLSSAHTRSLHIHNVFTRPEMNRAIIISHVNSADNDQKLVFLLSAFSHPAWSGELTAVTNLCFIISWPV